MTTPSPESSPKPKSNLTLAAVAALGVAVVLGGVGLYATRGSAGVSGIASAAQGVAEITLGGSEGESSPGESGGAVELEATLEARAGVPWPFRYAAGRVRLPLREAGDELAVASYPQEVTRGPLNVVAYHFNARVYERVEADPRPEGLVRRGTRLFAEARVYGKGCKGAWYPLTTGGYVCTTDGFHVTKELRAFDIRQPEPARDSALPFSYAKVENGALRYYRIPSEREQQRAEAYAARSEDDEGPDLGFPDVVEGKLDGAYFGALDRVESEDGRRFYRTVRGRYVREQDVEMRELPAMHGELLGGRWELPIAFVHGDEPADVLRAGRRSGDADKHGRMPVMKEQGEWVLGPGGYSLPRDRVRIARRVDVPDTVPRGARWVHVNLTEQTLVAYEGDEPVFATLITSGLEEPEFATPTGTYRVREKHVSVTMSGPDPDAGRYEVEEVPWTQYYYESYAIHGAYWHNDFGRVRSHGCTNLAPTDARWLFHWTSPDLPAGWQARRRAEGTYLVFTRDE